MRTTIVVTKLHIEKARIAIAAGGSPENSCPIVQAMHEQGFPDAIVCSPDIQPYGPRAPYVRPSRVVQGIVRHFDEGRDIQPFRFELKATPVTK